MPCNCGKCSSCKPKKSDYMPMDGEGYIGAMREYNSKRNRKSKPKSKTPNMWRRKSRGLSLFIKNKQGTAKQRRFASYILSTRRRAKN